MKRPFLPLIAAVCLQAFAYLALWKRVEPFVYHFYLMVWWSYIILLDSLLAIKGRKFLVLNRTLPYLIVMSCGFWCIFEMINLRLQNWAYINIPTQFWLRFPGYFLAFGTVIPGIYLSKEILSTLIGKVRVRRHRLRNYPHYAIPVGFLLLFLFFLFPRFLFPLAWIFLTPILDGYNYARGYSSFARDLENGSATDLVATLSSGLLCGFFWEAWNYWAIAKWVYAVPFFEGGKIFEMPAPGYLGFPFFGLETVLFFNLLSESSVARDHRWLSASAALMFSLLSFFLIDHYTVLSFAGR